MLVAILLDNGYEELEAMGPCALLKRAGIDVDLVRIPETEVTGRFGIRYTPTKYLKDYDFSKVDCLVVPGGPQHKTMRTNKDVLALLHAFAQHKKIGAICAAPTILGQEGLLKGKHYTCFEALNDDFGGIFHTSYTVTDGNIVTACSAAASVEFGFALIELLLGKEQADALKGSVYYSFEH